MSLHKTMYIMQFIYTITFKACDLYFVYKLLNK